MMSPFPLGKPTINTLEETFLDKTELYPSYNGDGCYKNQFNMLEKKFKL